MAMGKVHEYNQLIARAFNGAVVVDGLRIVAHPSGVLCARTPNVDVEQRNAALAKLVPDRDNDWSDV